MKGLADWILFTAKGLPGYRSHLARFAHSVMPYATIFPGHALPSALIGGKHYSINDSKNRAGHDDVRCA